MDRLAVLQGAADDTSREDPVPYDPVPQDPAATDLTEAGPGLRVEAVAWTQFAAPADVDWQTDAQGGEALAEFAGRACYESWDKPNPATATNAGYLRHVLDVGHLAVLEHSSVSFYVTGVSRALAHELVRHRHLSFSELSQRHVPARPEALVEPELIAADPRLHERFVAAAEAGAQAYAELLTGLEEALANDGAGVPVGDAALRRKQARQAARAVLPAATETRFVVTGNYRAWRHVIGMRAAEHADAPMRAFAVAVLRELQRLAPNAFADFVITTLPDGTEVAASPLVAET